jgi:hypothetical protein
LRALANQLEALEQRGTGALEAYVRNVKLGLIAKADHVVMEKR